MESSKLLKNFTAGTRVSLIKQKGKTGSQYIPIGKEHNGRLDNDIQLTRGIQTTEEKPGDIWISTTAISEVEKHEEGIIVKTRNSTYLVKKLAT